MFSMCSRAFAHPTRSRVRPDSAGNVKKADLLRTRVVERMNRLGGRLQQDSAAFFFAKYASASGDRCTLPIWPEPRISCWHPFSKTNFALSFERTCEVP